MYSYHVSTSSHDYQTTSTLLRLFISIAVTVGVVLVYAKPVLNNDQAGGFLIKQQQQPPNAGEEFVVPYGGDLPNYNLDNPDLNAEPPFGVPSNPTPTIQENPGPADGEPIAFEWLDNINSLILEILRGDAQTPLVTEAAAVKKSREDKFENFKCGEKKSVCCQNSPRISGKRICAKKNHYYPLPIYKIEGKVPPGKLPCVEPIYLQSCTELAKYKNNDCFSDCKAKPEDFGFGSFF